MPPSDEVVAYGGWLLTRRARDLLVPCLIVLALTLAVVEPPVSLAASRPPVVDAGSAPGPGWVAWRFFTDNSRVEARLSVDALGVPAVWGLQLYDDQQDPNLLFMLLIAHTLDQEGTLVRTVDVVEPGPPDLGVEIDELPDPDRAGGSTLAVAFTDWSGFHGGPAPAGDHLLLVWAAGDHSAHRWELRVEEPSHLEDRTNGTEVSLFEGPDLEATAQAQHYDAHERGVRAGVEGEAEVTIEHRLYGLYAVVGGDAVCHQRVVTHRPSCTDATGLDRLSARDPDGQRVCSGGCLFDHAGPGTYVFAHTGVDAALGKANVDGCSVLDTACAGVTTGRDHVLLSVVDAELPGPLGGT